jgi:hypothetical protein
MSFMLSLLIIYILAHCQSFELSPKYAQVLLSLTLNASVLCAWIWLPDHTKMIS